MSQFGVRHRPWTLAIICPRSVDRPIFKRIGLFFIFISLMEETAECPDNGGTFHLPMKPRRSRDGKWGVASFT
ncbi:MAG: hypothetical protein ACJ8MO_07330, partial [Bacillus sp. (in: firmicutes)]